MEAIKRQESRIVWIDWIKAIGIYLIVLGHFFSVGEKYVYVFNSSALKKFLANVSLSNSLERSNDAFAICFRFSGCW